MLDAPHLFVELMPGLPRRDSTAQKRSCSVAKRKNASCRASLAAVLARAARTSSARDAQNVKAAMRSKRGMYISPVGGRRDAVAKRPHAGVPGRKAAAAGSKRARVRGADEASDDELNMGQRDMECENEDGSPGTSDEEGSAAASVVASRDMDADGHPGDGGMAEQHQRRPRKPRAPITDLLTRRPGTSTWRSP